MKTKCSLIFMIMFFCFNGMQSFVYAQNSDIEGEILVYILPDSLEMPDGTTELTDVKKLKIKSKDLEKTFRKIELKSVKKAFPEFDVNDTLKTDKNGKKIKLPNMSRIFSLKLKKKEDLKEVIELLNEEKGVLFAETNMNAELFGDEDYGKQWYLNNTGQSNGTVDADIDAPEAWNIFTGSSSIKIGVIDSGVDLLHEDLSGKTSGDQTSGSYHGTHVAGIAAAKANNTHGGRGVDWNAQIISKQIFDGVGQYMGDVNSYNKIISAVNSGANVLNHSWGGTSYSTTVRLAFSYAYKNNRTSIVSMGNDYLYGNATKYPAAFGQGVIAVGATQDNDSRSPYSQTGNHIDVVAPGGLNSYPNNDQHDIWSSWSNNDYRFLAGTSMAAPVVSGIASLLKGYKSSLENDDIENIIRISADDKGATGWDQYYGTGRVNAKAALDFLRSPYVLKQNSIGGGSTYSNTGTYQQVFYGVSGLADGVYLVKRYEIRKTVSLGTPYLENYVWGRGVNTNAFSSANPNFGMGYCDVVSYNSSSATLRTYVYKVWSISGSYLGYYPTSPSGVNFKYTVLGKYSPLSVYISGPGSLEFKQQGTWTASVSGGSGSRTYAWYKSSDGVNWGGSVGSAQTFTTTMLFDDIYLKCVVTDTQTGETKTATKTVYYLGDILPKDAFEEGDNLVVPLEYGLSSNYPNPFNPSTVIKYQLKEPGHVSLKVYDVLGKKVAELVNGYKNEGFYESTFNASELSSGIYFYIMKVNEFVASKKMLLTK